MDAQQKAQEAAQEAAAENKPEEVDEKVAVNLSQGRGEKRPTSKGAGLTAKGRAKYNRETGSNLKAAVTQKNPTGEDKKRQDSFCRRMNGVKGAIRKDGELTRKGAALKRWQCNLG